MKTVLEMLEAHLREIGAEGLCCVDHDLDPCGCRLGDLAPCQDYQGVPAECVAAKLVDGEMVPLEDDPENPRVRPYPIE